MAYICAYINEMAFVIYLKHLSCVWKPETQGLSFPFRVIFNMVN
jgi:hypothetical protein